MLCALAVVLSLSPVFAEPALVEPEAVVVLPASARAALAKAPLKDAADLGLYVDATAARVRLGEAVWMALMVDGQVQRLAPLPPVRACLPVDLPIDGYWVVAGSEPTLLALGNDAWVAVWSDVEGCWLGTPLFVPPELEGEAVSAHGPRANKTALTVAGVGAVEASPSRLELGKSRVELTETLEEIVTGERALRAQRAGSNVRVVSLESSAADERPKVTRQVTALLDPQQVAPLCYEESLDEAHPGVFVNRRVAASVQLPIPGGALVGERTWLNRAALVDGHASTQVRRWMWLLDLDDTLRVLTPDTQGPLDLADLEASGRKTTRARFKLADGKTLDVTLTARSLKLVVKGGGRLELKAEGPRLRDERATVSLSQNRNCGRGPCWLSISWGALGETDSGDGMETSSDGRVLLWPVQGGTPIESLRQRGR